MIRVERTVNYEQVKNINKDLAARRPLATLARSFSVAFKSWMGEPRSKVVNMYN